MSAAGGEPERSWQDRCHQRIIQKDATAFAELSERLLPLLVEFLTRQFPQAERHLPETVAIDCLLGYFNNPIQYRTGGISLYAYLRMAARYDMLNAVSRMRRSERRLVELEALDAVRSPQDWSRLTSTQELDTLLHSHTQRSFPEILKLLELQLDGTERKVLELMLQGERSSEAYVNVLGIQGLDEREQRSEVARVKDRLMKRLNRLGKRL